MIAASAAADNYHSAAGDCRMPGMRRLVNRGNYRRLMGYRASAVEHDVNDDVIASAAASAALVSISCCTGD